MQFCYLCAKRKPEFESIVFIPKEHNFYKTVNYQLKKSRMQRGNKSMVISECCYKSLLNAKLKYIFCKISVSNWNCKRVQTHDKKKIEKFISVKINRIHSKKRGLKMMSENKWFVKIKRNSLRYSVEARENNNNTQYTVVIISDRRKNLLKTITISILSISQVSAGGKKCYYVCNSVGSK